MTGGASPSFRRWDFCTRGTLVSCGTARSEAIGLLSPFSSTPRSSVPMKTSAPIRATSIGTEACWKKRMSHVLFHPSIRQIYPEGYQSHVNVDNLSVLLCGAHRPGHFQGVATVVAKLFNIVRPHVAIFGEKDYQQLQLIRRLVRDLNFDIEVVGHPIVREADGLAMSSRNFYLTPEERQAALCLSRSLIKAACLVQRGETQGSVITKAVSAEIEKEPLARGGICYPLQCGYTETVEEIRESALLALAARIGKTRLIDNLILQR